MNARPGSRARWVRRLACAVAIVAAGCGRERAKPLLPETRLPPEIVAVHPPARSAGVFYETEIWADFAAPLDPATVNDTTVFLKLDTRRVPVTVSYEPERRRIRLTPRIVLELRRTYTIDLTPDLATADGARLSQTWFWQFTTNSVRRPGAPVPANGAGAQSLFTMLSWSGTEPSAGDILYRVYRGTDSAAVASHAVVPALVPQHSYYLSDPRWPADARTFWSVGTINQSTGEELDGPLWSFGTIPAGLQLDSLTLLPTRWAYFFLARVVCNGGGLRSGVAITCALRFALESLPADLDLAGAELVLTPSSTSGVASIAPSLWLSTQDWSTCDIGYPGPPYTDEDTGRLADGVLFNHENRDRLRLASDALTSHVEAAIHRRGTHGYILRSEENAIWIGPGGSEFDFRFRLYYFRPRP